MEAGKWMIHNVYYVAEYAHWECNVKAVKDKLAKVSMVSHPPLNIFYVLEEFFFVFFASTLNSFWSLNGKQELICKGLGFEIGLSWFKVYYGGLFFFNATT